MSCECMRACVNANHSDRPVATSIQIKCTTSYFILLEHKNKNEIQIWFPTNRHMWIVRVRVGIRPRQHFLTIWNWNTYRLFLAQANPKLACYKNAKIQKYATQNNQKRTERFYDS